MPLPLANGPLLLGLNIVNLNRIELEHRTMLFSLTEEDLSPQYTQSKEDGCILAKNRGLEHHKHLLLASRVYFLGRFPLGGSLGKSGGSSIDWTASGGST